MKLIPLGNSGLYAKVDDEDYDELMQYKWRARRDGQTAYAVRSGRGNSAPVTMHKHLTGYAVTDHADGDGTNNQRANLRESNKQLNGLNKIRKPGASNRFVGVRLMGTGKWMARCPRHSVIDAGRPGISPTFHVGTYSREEDAARARDEAVRVRFGQHGVYSFPRPGERSAFSGLIEPGLTSP